MTMSMMDRMFQQAETLVETSFAGADVLATLSEASDEQLDALDFGVVAVDDHGLISKYNRFESEITGTPEHDALGKNFFTQVAPCTNNALFRGAFKRGVEAGAMNLLFPYTFTYRMAPTNVRVHLHRALGGERNWILIERV